jgi:hypothetical protein
VFQLFFKGKLQDEEGYVLYVRKNALQILIPRYGLECTLFLARKGETSNVFEYDEEVIDAYRGLNTNTTFADRRLNVFCLHK